MFKEALEKVCQPVTVANGLPNEFYTDPEVFEREKQLLFADTWACIGFAKDVPEPGDALPLEFVGRPVLAVRGNDRAIKVFDNVCRHRGMILIDKPTKVRGTIRCPYHSWCYELDGRLRSTPHVGGAGVNSHECIKKDELGLMEIRSHVFMDMIFVNLSGTAPDFETHIAKLSKRWGEFVDRPLFHGGPESSFSLELDTNWKLAVENYCESYHLPWVHPGLNSYSKIEDHYNIVEPGIFAGQGTTVYNPQINGSKARFPDFDRLSQKWDQGAEYIALFPNVLLGVHRDHYFSILLNPVAHNRTIEQVEIYYTSPQVQDESWSKARREAADMWLEVFREDIDVVEGMQRGRAAPTFDGGRFSPVLDEATHCFHHWTAIKFQT
ncbi:Rieske-type non-heme iron aromatic ring-hydroxylating oxygenase (RHO) family [hydrothermal vent metagenome]|uniref:Rieske-type non-heme iron aromatic ring-hydroxylating oxygenase (RHO) family n=1 Tax=hydrothermal vent metagenome TaxID=652676 RepID=A0A3B0RYE7_9ZZZZ